MLELMQVMRRDFDADYYASEYPDVQLPQDRLFGHFLTIGWFEGRNPSPFFDTTSYLLRYPDVALAGLNPLAHYIWYGQHERREVVPSASPSTRSRLLFGHTITDWVHDLRPLVDVDYYRKTIGTQAPKGIDPVAHFAYRGWQQGLNPSATLRTSSLCAIYPQAIGMLVNPLLAHREATAGRYSPPASWPEVSDGLSKQMRAGQVDSAELRSPTEAEIDRVRSEFDFNLYVACYPDVASSGADPFEHYFYTGWREGRNPTETFDTAFYLSTYTDVRVANANPFWHFVTFGRAQGRLSRAPSASTKEERPADAETLALIRGSFSTDYYLVNYPDVKDAGIDPVEHYFHTGWKENRNPSRHFDTKYYLTANPDVRDAGINPFWHYLVAGKAEGRAPKRLGGYRREIIEAAREPCQASDDYAVPSVRPLDPIAFAERIQQSGPKGLVVSVSHDCYVKIIGGTQIFIADEQRRFAQCGYSYLHISPLQPRLSFADPDPDFQVQVVFDREFLGTARLRDLISFVNARPRVNRSLLIVHCALGFDPHDLCKLHSAVSPERSVYWLHDYSSLCEGYNLLRNDLEFCHAPESNSLVCRVCVYGANRERHLLGMRRLFDHCHFDVIAPSEIALDVWRKRSTLPFNSAAVHPHWALRPKRARSNRGAKEIRTRIGFVGFPFPSKGWQLFVDLVDKFGKDERFSFYHFGTKPVLGSLETKFVETAVTCDDRFAAMHLLAKHRIDYLAILSPWPETFSFVAHEGIASGCALLCLRDSGNVAALVDRTDQGVVFDDMESLCDFLEGPALALRADKRKRCFQILEVGTTATYPGLSLKADACEDQVLY